MVTLGNRQTSRLFDTANYSQDKGKLTDKP